MKQCQPSNLYPFHFLSARLGLLTSLLLGFSGTPLLAVEYYIAPNGNDTASGGFATPWLTIARANAAAQPGDTILFRAGTYRETLRPAVSGTAS
jgi:Protein of unknown function (DUF1565)